MAPGRPELCLQRSKIMNVQETQIFNSEEQIEKPRRGNTWFAMLFALLIIPLIIK